jgi:hypothetical protein
MTIDYQVPFNKQPSHVSLSKSFGLQELFLPFEWKKFSEESEKRKHNQRICKQKMRNAIETT